MKHRLSPWPMKALAALELMLALYPICLLLGSFFLPDQPLLWHALPLVTLLWGVTGYLLPGKLRLPFALVGCGLLIGIWIVRRGPISMASVTMLIPCILFLLMLPAAWSQPVWEEWSSLVWTAGIIFHLIGQFLSGMPRYAGTGIAVPMMIAFALYAFLMLMALNRQGLRDGMHGAQKAPAPLRRRNTALIIGLFAVALAASLWDTLGALADRAWNTIKYALGLVIAWLLSFLPENRGGGGGNGGMGELAGMMGEGEPSLFAIIMEKVFWVLSFAALAVGAVLLLRLMAKAARKLWKRIMDHLRRFAAAASEDYVDEAESTRTLEETARTLREKMQQALARPPRALKWEELDGRGRVRRLYQQFLKKRPEARYQTAREAISRNGGFSRRQASEFAQLYERARYSDHVVEEREADQLRNEIR